MFEFHVTLLDNGGNRTVKKFALSAPDYATASADANAILNDLQAVTNLVVSKTSLNEVTTLNPTLPPDGVQKENQAAITMSLAGKDQKYVHYIPAPDISIFVDTIGSGADIVNVNAPPLVQYFNTIKAKTVVSDGDVLDAMIIGKRIHKANKKG